ncbi:hypothetical protein JCM10212_002449 [Sporobolomyces blumeae]
MSFNFEWPEFSDAFYTDAREMLAQALNKGQKPPIIADRIEVKELNMGTIPPELEILEIGDLSTDRFRGIFRLTYSGDAYIVLQTKVQANPLNVPRPSLDILGAPRILYAAAPLVVPMTLRLSSLSLRAIVVLVVSRQKGITLVFKNDPLESVDVSSSFDGVESVAGFIQREIEGQLREAFRSDLPSVIHRLSQKWLSGEVKSAGEGAAGLGPKARVGLAGGFDEDAKIETRTAYAGGGTGPEGGMSSEGIAGRGRRLTREMDAPSEMGESVELDSQVDSAWSTWGGDRVGSSGRSAGSRTASRASSYRRAGTSPTVAQHDQLDSVPESIEAYDPTYGLRPDSIPHHAGFGDYERLVKAGSSKRGLGDVLEAVAEDEADEAAYGHNRTGDGSFDFDLVGLRDLVEDDVHTPLPRWSGSYSDHGHPRHSFDSLDVEPDRRSSFETIPAVGGGTITRPRVFHTQSQIRTRTASTGSLSAHGSPSSATARSVGAGSAASTVGLGGAARFARSASLQQLTPLEDREDYFAAPSASVASTPRFPFPRYPPPPAYSAGSAPSIVRNQSMPSFSRYQSATAVHRSNLSWQLSASSTSNDASSRASRIPPSYSSPNTALTTPIASPTRLKPPLPTDDPDGERSLSFTRPSPADLLSRSPSSVLNTSFLDEEHLPITLNPGQNDSCAHLKTLSSTNQTLSPFTRENELVMARSSPHPSTMLAGEDGAQIAPNAAILSRNRAVLHPTGSAPSSAAQPVKATRKRLHRIGSAKSPPTTAPSSAGSSGSPAMSRRNSAQFPNAPASTIRIGHNAYPTPPPSVPPMSPVSTTAPNPSSSRRRGPLPRANTTGVPNAHRKMPSLSGSVRGGGGGSVSGTSFGMGIGRPRAPSELSDYFPATTGAREMLNRLRLS